MNIWVIYDIESSKAGNKRRRKIVKEIEKFGLIRIQKSVFAGKIEKNRMEELIIFSDDLIKKDSDSVYIFPMCKEDYDNVKIIGLGFDKEMISGEKGTLVI